MTQPQLQENERFVVEPDQDDAEVLHVIDASNGANITVCTCWQEPGFAHDIARLLNAASGGS